MLALSSLNKPPPIVALPSLSFLLVSPSPLPTTSSIFLRVPHRIRSHLSLSLQMEPINPTQIAPFANNTYNDNHHLKIAIIGFGNHGQFLAKTFVSQGHTVHAYSRFDHSLSANALGVSFFYDVRDLFEQHPDVILLCMSINSSEEVLNSLPLKSLKRSTLIVDVMSVKEFAKSLLLKVLPEDFDVICSHPMFGPQSAKFGWQDLTFVYEIVRIGNEEFRVDRCKRFLEIFEREGCKMVEMSCYEHDKYAAGLQFITHTVGRVLKMLNLESTPINTKGYESLLELVENVGGDSFDLYYALFMFNKNSLDMLERFDVAFKELRKQLIGSLHKAVSKLLLSSEGHQNGSALAANSTSTR